VPYLEVQLTKKLERIYDLGGKTVVGRAPECQVQLLSRAVSRRHAVFEVVPGGVALQDLGAANGIKLNGARLGSKGTAALKEGDRVVVGDVPMVYRASSRVLASGESMDVRGQDLDVEQLLGHLQRPRAAFTLPNDPAYLADFQANVSRARIEQLTLSDEAKLKLQIALAEAVENAITHGSGGDANRPIQVLFEETEEEIKISVRDLGAGFDAEKVLAHAQEIDSLAVIRDREKYGTGLGLRMILDCVDRLQFEIGNPGCTIHMSKYKDEDAGMLVIEDDAPEPSNDPDEPPVTPEMSTDDGEG
jgi:anti-sigma regulatory factor (Ser/Thr protein kinase)